MISKLGDEFMPRRMTKHSAGYDLYAPFEVNIAAGGTLMFDTGIALEDGDIQDNQFLMVLPRSSMGFKYGLRMSNTCPIIDSDYRETIKVSITVDRDCHLHRGERFAQMIVMTYGTIAGEIQPTEVRMSGIGSTGA